MTMDLRTQFLNFMTVERYSVHTKRLYMRSVIGLVKFYNQSPDTLTNEQIQEYFRHLIEDRKLSWGTCNNYFSAIICFYRVGGACEYPGTLGTQSVKIFDTVAARTGLTRVRR
jgi:integrase/recombinase XerD